MGHAAGQENVDERFGFGLFGGAFVAGLGSLEAEHLVEGQAKRSRHAHIKKTRRRIGRRK